METSPPFEFPAEIERQVDQLVHKASESGDPFDFEALAADLEVRLEERGVAGLDPPDPDYWRLTVAALRRRAGLPV